MKLLWKQTKLVLEIGARIARILTAWFVVWFLVSLLIRMLGPDPTTQIAGPLSDEATREQFVSEFGLDEPLIIQSLKRSTQMISGDWGVSWRSKQPVLEMVASPAALSVGLAFVASILSIVIAMVISLALSRKRVLLSTRIAHGTFIFFAVIPSFVLGLWIVASQLPDWTGLPRYGLDAGSAGYFRGLILPAISLTFPGVGLVLPRLRETLATMQNAPWYLNACALGMSERRIIFSFGLPAVLTALGDSLAQVWITSITGAVAVEHVFSLPGLGTLLVDSVQTGDIPTVLGVVAVTTIFVMCTMALRQLMAYGLPEQMRAEISPVTRYAA